MLPEAYVTHRLPRRLRIRIPSRKREEDFFEAVRKRLPETESRTVRVSALTGSVLIQDEGGVDLAEVASLGKSSGLFALADPGPEESSSRANVAAKAAEPVRQLNDRVKRLTRGRITLPALAFLGLLAMGFYQINEGNMVALPWYAAFWYAFDLYLKADLGGGPLAA